MSRASHQHSIVPRLALAFATLLLAAGLMGAGTAFTALVVPTEIQQPGTQPLEVAGLESPNKCDNCHGGYSRTVEPAFNWRGSMMANAGRDSVFWATLAVAEQDFPGAGNFCIRCHSTAGWLAGRALPTDGSGLTASDADGVECDACHKSTNPNNAEHLGVMNPPYVANDKQSPAAGYNGSGMLSLWGGAEKLGPYSNATPPHSFKQSRFHRDVDFCGSCHDVSNPAVGDLASNNGKQATGDPVVASGTLGSPVAGKAAFNNFPFKYGVVERTFSEYKAGLLSKTAVASYASLPADLKAGAIKAAFDNAGGNYADGTPRYFSCQTCHMRPVTGQGANMMMSPVRSDLPLHDLTGGNTWAPEVILYQNARGTLRLGGGMTTTQIEAVTAGKERARQQLQLAASLAVSGNTLKLTNLTGHKLISGYPEGRRMWLNVRWYDATNALLREDGRYGDLAVSTPGAPATVKTILDLDGTNTKIYEAHYAMTQEWASQLLGLGYPPSLPLSFDRVTGSVAYTLGELATQAPGTDHETFHFVLNNRVVKDNRIPTYGMSYDEARKRNALPVPAAQYGSPGPGGTFRYWDEIELNPPTGSTRATIDLLYQSTSWEYIQFLHVANNGSNAFLANEGANLLVAWANTGMSTPIVMASAIWVGSAVPTFALTVNKDGAGGGTVTSNPAGIACGAICSANFNAGTLVTLSAVPASDSVFGGWSGGGCTGKGSCVVTMDAARNVTATFAAAGSFRAYLSRNGSDGNPCTLPAPCRLLPAALAAVRDRGEIWMLDSANFNTEAVDIAKSVTILAVPGALGSVVANNAQAIRIGGSSTLEVTLRNLVVLNLSGSGNTGIQFGQGAQLTVEGCEIYGLGTGVAAGASGSLLTIRDTTIRDNASAGVSLLGAVFATLDQVALLNNAANGVLVQGGAQALVAGSTVTGSATGASAVAAGGAITRLTLTETELSGNGTAVGVSAVAGGDTAQVVLGASTITHSATAIALSGAGSATVFTRQNNTLKFNGTDVTGGTLTPQGGL